MRVDELFKAIDKKSNLKEAKKKIAESSLEEGRSPLDMLWDQSYSSAEDLTIRLEDFLSEFKTTYANMSPDQKKSWTGAIYSAEDLLKTLREFLSK